MNHSSKTKRLFSRRSELTPTLYELYFENGGELPRELSGKYTSEKEALIAADNYLSKKNRAV